MHRRRQIGIRHPAIPLKMLENLPVSRTQLISGDVFSHSDPDFRKRSSIEWHSRGSKAQFDSEVREHLSFLRCYRRFT
jgi:hypothetical protein